jgi:hypothetical protein
LNKNNHLILDIFDLFYRWAIMIDLDTFLKTYDRVGNIVLLAGSRKVAAEDEIKLRKLGNLLTERSQFITFRSGNAEGADQFFTLGVGDIDPKRIEIFIPYPTHRPENRVGYDAFSLDQVDVVNEPTLIEQAMENRGTRYGVQQVVKGAHQSAQRAYGELILRSTLMVTGAQHPPVKPANFAIFYVDRTSKKPGGTGHTMQVCENMNVVHVDQDIWISWLE